MTEYISSLGHPVEERDFTSDFHRETQDRTAAMNGRMRNALKAVGVDPNGEDPRAVATAVLNGMAAEDRPGMITLASQLWHPNLPIDSGEIEEELGVLDPSEVEEKVTLRLAWMARQNPRAAIEWLKNNPKTDPTPYMQHMDESGHGSATAESMRRLRDTNGLVLSGPNMEIGSGPGNIAAHLIKRGMMPQGNLHLVDSSTQWLGHALPLIGKVDPSRPVKIHPTDAAAVNPPEEVGTVWTALPLQCFDNPNATLENLRRITGPSSRVFFVGETPTNATANTPRGLHGGLDIGFSHGAFSYEQICEMFGANGFVPERKGSMVSMAMPTPDPAFLESLSPDMRKKAELMLAYSDHTMVGTAWRTA